MSGYLCRTLDVEAPSQHGSFLDMDMPTAGKTVFLFVRNPFEREFSEWKYHAGKRGDVPHNLSFTEWVYWRYADMPLPESYFGRPGVSDYLRTFSRYPQLGWMLDTECNLKTDLIGFFETRKESTESILSELGIPLDSTYPITEASHQRVPTSDYRKFYTAKTRKLIEDRYKPDLEAFGYTFESREGNKKINLSAVSDFSFVEKVGSYLHK